MACNCEGNTYHIGMGCCTPVVANANDYYTKSQVDEKINDIAISGGVTADEVQTMIDDNLDDYYTKDEVDAGFATVNDELDTKLDASAYTPTDLSNYYTKQQTNGLLDNKLDASAYTPTDLSNYYTKSEIENKHYLTEHQHLKTINNISLVGDGNIEIGTGGTIDLSDYYTKSETNSMLSNKLDASAYTPTDLSNYFTKSEVNARLDLKANASDLSALSTTVGQLSTSLENKADKSEIPSLNGYATQQWVQSQNYLTEHQQLKTINNESLIGTGNITISGGSADLSNYYTKTEVDNTFATQVLLDNVSNRVNTHTGNTTIHVTANDKTNWNNKVDSSTLNNYMLKSQIWCGTQSEYDSITTKDNDTIYLIHA